VPHEGFFVFCSEKQLYGMTGDYPDQFGWENPLKDKSQRVN